eukprot:11942667-Heterocapsa_arctica.AAC.1
MFLEGIHVTSGTSLPPSPPGRGAPLGGRGPGSGLAIMRYGRAIVGVQPRRFPRRRPRAHPCRPTRRAT